MKNYIILTILTFLTLFAGCNNPDETTADDFYIDYVPQWDVDNSMYEHSMQIICTLRLNSYIFENSDDMVAAFINDECVGYTKPVDSENTGQSVFLLTVFGNSADDIITFKMYDAKNSRLIDADNVIEFIPSGMLQSVTEPLDIFRINN
jgi:hypothetical protein